VERENNSHKEVHIPLLLHLIKCEGIRRIKFLHNFSTMTKRGILQFYYTRGRTVLFCIRLELNLSKTWRDTGSCPCYVAYFM